MAPQPRRRWRWIVGAVVLVVVGALVAAAAVLATSKASLTSDPTGIARVDLPFGSGTIQSVSVVSGRDSHTVPVKLTKDPVIVPTKLVPAGAKLAVEVVVKRPGWISWLAGDTQRLDLNVTAPAASLRSHYLTVAHEAPLRLRFKAPISVYWTGRSRRHMTRHVLNDPQSTITLPHSGAAGTTLVAAAPRAWESAHASMIGWFPSGGKATAVAKPAPGTQITPSTRITLTFSKPVHHVLGAHLPPVSPTTQGTWHQINSHTIQFRPHGYGYGLAAHVQIPLPNGVRITGGQQSSANATTANDTTGNWTVPAGSTARLQQLLAKLGYLPLTFTPAGSDVAQTASAQEKAAVDPPKGSFAWRYPDTPDTLKSFWQSGSYGTMTRGAVMAFENDHGMTADGIAGPQVWKALIDAAITGKGSSFGYSFVSVSVASQSLTLWHNGKNVIGSTAVNTGIPSAPTATGTYPVYEHLPVTTMSGTNPDGSHYHDTGIPWVSYFNGGDALHGFTRAQYGSPQSLGCVEMPFSVAGQVYPYTPIGTLVHVA
ncbi:MAG: L,D-transpeptidase family protein [Solirubrobacteraceae bacterium]